MEILRGGRVDRRVVNRPVDHRQPFLVIVEPAEHLVRQQGAQHLFVGFEPVGQAADIAIGHPLEFHVVDRGRRGEGSQLVKDHPQRIAGAVSLHAGGNGEGPLAHAGADRRAHAIGPAARFPEVHVEAREEAVADHLVGQFQRFLPFIGAVQGQQAAKHQHRLRRIGPVHQHQPGAGRGHGGGQVLDRPRGVAPAPAAKAGFQQGQQLLHRDVAHHGEAGDVRTEPFGVFGPQVGRGQPGNHPRIADGGGQGIGVLRAIEHAAHRPAGKAARRGLLLGNLGQALRLHAGEILVAESGVERDVGHQRQRLRQVAGQRGQGDAGGIHAGRSGNRCTQVFLLADDGQRVAGGRALAQHVDHQLVAAGLGRGIGGGTGIQREGNGDGGNTGAANQRHVHAIAQRDPFGGREIERGDIGHRRNFACRAGARGGNAAAGIRRWRRVHRLVTPAAHRAAIQRPLARNDGQGIGGAGKPAVQGIADFCRRQARNPLQVAPVLRRIAGIEQPFGQHHALAAKAADVFQRAELAGDELGGGAAHLLLCRAIAHHPGDLGIEQGFGSSAVGTRRQIEIGRQEAELFMHLGTGQHPRGQFLAIDHGIVEPRGRQAAQDVHPHLQRHGIGVVEAGAGPVAGNAQLADLVSHLLADRRGQGNGASLHLRHVRPAGNVTEPAFHHRAGGDHVNVARQHQHHVVGAVIVAEPVLHVFQRGGGKVCHRTDGGMAIGVAHGQQALGHAVIDQAIGLVVALPLLVLDHAALPVEPFLADRAQQVAHAVGLHHQRPVKRAGGHGFDVVGPVIPGGAVGRRGPGGFQRNVEVLHVLAAGEHDVFEQVGKTGAPARFVLGADAVIDRDAHDRGLAVGMRQYGEAVGQGELLVGNVYLGNQRGKVVCCRSLGGSLSGRRCHGHGRFCRGWNGGATCQQKGGDQGEKQAIWFHPQGFITKPGFRQWQKEIAVDLWPAPGPAARTCDRARKIGRRRFNRAGQFP